ncbi:nucleolar and spindle-associated protein 1 isoform X2 [Octopus bimaculoides]|uniref:nucleolar and spindle-associated protein 1 isoform X2 n=1 Tax=Octopus bimaculoides TaxID=37653 RepID=UPI00071DEEF3|nr:nucleolar and spindle-associated protein 1 isoform X2 [Octopus bimaculoides]|eukprot:XP_014783753.1 PREDICTED: nucleolar and spindle-associated protein 1-like isoform X2 [Octopus bimaculoides]
MDDLENLSYHELRNLAKDLGIKAKGKADKLIREIKKIQNDGSNPNHTRRLSQPEAEFHAAASENSSEKTGDTSDNEIIFVKNPDRQITVDVGDFLEVHNKRNSTAELKDCEDELDKLSEHNQTVDFEDFEENSKNGSGTKELENGSVLDATYEVLPDVEDPEDESTNDDPAVKKNDSVNDLLDVMKPDMTNEEMKAELIAAIDKKVQKRTTTNTISKAGTEFDNCVNMVLSSKKESNIAEPSERGKKWEKIHQKMFQKFDSLDVYLEKKNRRAQKLLTPARLAKQIAEENKKISEKQSCQSLQSKIPKRNPVTSFIPKVTSVKEMCLQFTNSSSKLPKTSKNVQETSAKQLSAKKVSSASKKTDCRAPFMSPRLNERKTEKKVFTPFNFTANKNTPSSGAKKPKFDLQASLAKPITWKQHKGKLKPLSYGDTEPTYFKKGLQTSIEENRKNRRTAVLNHRASRRANLINARRNVNMQ